jgi:hypothetical protein
MPKKFEGFIDDGRGHPLEGIPAVVTTLAGAPVTNGVTDSAGHWSFSNLPTADEYVITLTDPAGNAVARAPWSGEMRELWVRDRLDVAGKPLLLDPAAGNALVWGAAGLFVPPISAASDAYTRAESDARFVNTTGDVLTGALDFGAVYAQQIIVNASTEGWLFTSTPAGYDRIIWHRQQNKALVIHNQTANLDLFNISTGGNANVVGSVTAENKLLRLSPESGNTLEWRSSGFYSAAPSQAAADARYVQLTGGSVMTGLLGPTATNALDLGTSALRWRKLWGVDADLSGTTNLSVLTAADFTVPGTSGRSFYSDGNRFGIYGGSGGSFEVTRSNGGQISFASGNIVIDYVASPMYLDISGEVRPTAVNASNGYRVQPLGETQPRFNINSSGAINWGPGGSTPTDASLARAGANDLRVAASFNPTTTNARDLGTTSLRWRKLWMVALDASGAVTFSGTPTVAGNPLTVSPTAGNLLSWLSDGLYASAPAAVTVEERPYNYSTTTTMADPGNNYLRVAADSLTLAIDSQDFNAADMTGLLGALRTGDSLYFVSIFTPTQWKRFTVSAAPTNMTGWWSVPVTAAGAGTAIPNNTPITLVIDFGAAGGSGGMTQAEADARYEPLDSMYTKAESDARFEPFDSAYTKAEADARYPLKTDPDPYPTYLTQAEGDGRYLRLAGGTLAGSLAVNADLAYDLGSPSMRWNVLNANTAVFVAPPTVAGSQLLTRVAGDVFYVPLVGGNVMAGPLGPTTNNTSDLGTTAVRWRKLWSVDADFTNAPTVGGSPLLTTAAANAGYLSLHGSNVMDGELWQSMGQPTHGMWEGDAPLDNKSLKIYMPSNDGRLRIAAQRDDGVEGTAFIEVLRSGNAITTLAVPALTVGATLAAWPSTRRAVQIGQAAALVSDTAASLVDLNENSYYDGTFFRAFINAASSRWRLTGGSASLDLAPSVAAGAAQTFATIVNIPVGGRGVVIGSATMPAWATTWRTLHLGQGVGLSANTAANQLMLAENSYWDGSNSRAVTNAVGSLLQQSGGVFTFYTFASVAAGAVQTAAAQDGIGPGTRGFFGTAPTTKKTVSGAKGSNAALGSLLTALAAYGLITDTTTT